MQGTKDFTVFLLRRVIFFLAVSVFIIVCNGGELSESETFFNFLRAIDPQNVLNISWNIGSTSYYSHPCLLKLNGVRCNPNNGTNITEIRLENLNLSGIIDADSLCRLQKLRIVNLAKNQIRGNIPNSILHCTRLIYLNLTKNQLSGRVPRALTKLKYLHKLDISNNNFSGIIPRKQEFRNLFIYYVTSSMLQSPSTRNGIKDQDTAQQPMANPPSNSKSDNSNKPWYTKVKTLLPLTLGIGLFLLFLYFVAKKSAKLNAEIEQGLKSHDHGPSIVKTITEVKEKDVRPMKRDSDSELVFFGEDHERFTLEDLLRAAADLTSENFGSSLYKVKLDNDVYYAVKRLKNLQVSSEEFGETLRQISNLKHPNILPLVGYRSTGEEKLIFYKYQSNGSLLNLFKDYIEGKKEFPWRLRLSIARGIARSLAFTYQKLEEKEVITHGNLKLSNILLDENNEPLISEHGLSKFLDPNRGFLFSSHGYIAPEKSLTEKGDVYSFGVILLELLTGKSVEVSKIDLPKWVRSMVREEWTGEVFDKEVKEAEHEWAFPVLNIALKCVSHAPENRPNMEEILEKIEGIMHEHEQQEPFAVTCCPNGTNHDDCCSLHKIIPDTWDSPGSNY